jgi:hypothetical protein
MLPGYHTNRNIRAYLDGKDLVSIDVFRKHDLPKGSLAQNLEKQTWFLQQEKRVFIIINGASKYRTVSTTFRQHNACFYRKSKKAKSKGKELVPGTNTDLLFCMCFF